MEAIYDRLGVVKKTLLESSKNLSDYLNPNGILMSMKTKGALTQDEVTKIQKNDTHTEQVNKLIEELIRKPATAYETFMEILRKERSDLYNEVRAIEGELLHR